MSEVAILHEGNAKKTNDNALLKLLMNELGLDIGKVKFFGMGNKSRFFELEDKNYKELKIYIDSEKVNKILFVVDADYERNDKKYGGYKNTENALKNIIDELGFKEYSDIYIVCDPETKEGYLESLILSSIPLQHNRCIQDFLSCSEFKSKDNHKSILNQIYKIGYPNKPGNFILWFGIDDKPIGIIITPGKSASIANNLNIATEYGIMFGLERVNRRGDTLSGAYVEDIRAAGFDVVYAPTPRNSNHVRIISKENQFDEMGREWLSLAIDRIARIKKE